MTHKSSGLLITTRCNRIVSGMSSVRYGVVAKVVCCRCYKQTCTHTHTQMCQLSEEIESTPYSRGRQHEARPSFDAFFSRNMPHVTQRDVR